MNLRSTYGLIESTRLDLDSKSGIFGDNKKTESTGKILVKILGKIVFLTKHETLNKS